MGDPSIGLHEWLATPPGSYLLAWEQRQMDAAVGNAFGFHALQLGMPELDALATNRMPHRWLATESPHPQATFVTHFGALPFPDNSLDLVVLPHTLELTSHPHAALREVERVLVPEGRVVICGLNPLSLWGFRQQRGHLYRRFGLNGMFLPEAGEFIGYRRIRDWLRLLGLELESGEFGCYRPALDNAHWLARFAWMDSLGARWWPILGAVYCLVAVKRVFSTTLINPRWRPVIRLPTAPVTVANSAGNTRATAINTLESPVHLMPMKPVDIYTDGACKGNPGARWLGALLQSADARKELFGGELETTNNRMEMMAVIEALTALKRPCKVTLHVDSQYVLKGMTEWLPNWKARGWKTATKAPVKNADLWQRLDSLVNSGLHQIEWRWVRGHNGHPGNERADQLANQGVDLVLRQG